MSGADWQTCERCSRRCYHYNGLCCAQCKREDAAKAQAREAARERTRQQLGRVGDETRAAAIVDDFNAKSRAIREAAGCARRPSP